MRFPAVPSLIIMILVSVAFPSQPGFAEGAHLSLFDPRVAQNIRDGFSLLEKGQTQAALNALQELLDAALEDAAIVDVRESPGNFRSYHDAASVVIRGLQRQPDDVVAEYRALFDPRASAVFEAALGARDPDELLACCRRYPVATVAVRAAVAAGDLWLERQDLTRAEKAWNSVPPSLMEPEQREEIVLRRQLLRRTRGKKSVSAPALLATEQLARASWRTPVSLDPDGRLDRLLGSEATYAVVPVVDDECLHAVTPLRVHRIDLSSGVEISTVELPVFPGYEEPSAVWRIEPAVSGSRLVTSFVADATRKVGRGRRSGVIRAAVPKRALCGISFDDDGPGRIIWRSTACDDPLVRRLSFNSTPRIEGDRVYAMGWAESGYVDAWLVAFDLDRGELIWKTLLVSNQVDLTRFGELAEEPRLGEFVLDGETIFACTNLGAFVAVGAANGRVQWLTEYFPVRPLLDIYSRRRLSYPYQSQVWWERCSVVPRGDRVIVTPQDTSRLFAFDRNTGQIVQRRRVRGYPNFLLGVQDGDLVICSSRRVTRVPWSHLDVEGKHYWLEGSTQTRPVLLDGGVIYATSDALKSVIFAESPLRQFLGRLHGQARRSDLPRRSRSSAAIRNGALSQIGHRIILANSYQLESYQLVFLK